MIVIIDGIVLAGIITELGRDIGLLERVVGLK
jgi:hypothetical protein